jgi:diguanylate cyclase (GGDEF)-like protein
MGHLLRSRSEMAPRRVRNYSPHRALIALGGILITVATAGGAWGVVQSAGAEHDATLITSRYMVLPPAVRAARVAGEDFQLVAERAFAGSDTDALFPAEVTDESGADRTYLDLHRLLALPDNAGLAPGLARLETAYVASRNALAKILATGTQSPATASLVTTERADYQKLDAAFAALQNKISGRLGRLARQVQADTRNARNGLLLSLGVGIPFGIAVTTFLAREALHLERDLARRDAVQARNTRRNEFTGRLQRALEMAKAEEPVFALVTQALGDAAPNLRAELLLADSSRAHFRQVLVSPVSSEEAGCGVVSPDDCPAAARGQTLVFPESAAMDACPYLRRRDHSALCVPVSISGNSIGVVHVTAAEGSPPGDEVMRDVEVVARRASERLAMLRAFAVSETEANSDSLTGLLTRRSLQSQASELHQSGVSYAVAYGDLDHFKELNDVFGHDAGDRALRTFSQVLRDALRPSDIPCRYGGEEFVIVLPSCNTDDAVAVLERVRERIAVRLESGHLPSFTVSFGVASSDQAADFEDVVALADDALLQAKTAGRDQIVVNRDGDLSRGSFGSVGDHGDPNPPARPGGLAAA